MQDGILEAWPKSRHVQAYFTVHFRTNQVSQDLVSPYIIHIQAKQNYTVVPVCMLQTYPVTDLAYMLQIYTMLQTQSICYRSILLQTQPVCYISSLCASVLATMPRTQTVCYRFNLYVAYLVGVLQTQPVCYRPSLYVTYLVCNIRTQQPGTCSSHFLYNLNFS